MFHVSSVYVTLRRHDENVNSVTDALQQEGTPNQGWRFQGGYHMRNWQGKESAGRLIHRSMIDTWKHTHSNNYMTTDST